MKYHGGSRFGLDERRQSYIYWLCQNIDIISPRKRNSINRLIEECADGEEEALREALCSKRSITAVAMEYYISESALQRRCDKFYKKAEKVI
ncbi:MAG: hypothetical protein IKU42_05990 [Oscillospiraceae bacterium]|nr:hypothetical protein [Oscillospiraceae bacterium]